MRNFTAFFLAAGLFFFNLGPVYAAGPSFDHSLWDRFLKEHVNENGEVDYAGVKKDPSLLNDYLSSVRAVAREDDPMHWPVRSWPREEQLAFWLNVYHAVIVEQVIKHYPLKSLNDVSGVWTLPVLQIGARHFSLNDIRARELLSTFRDEKIHLALACSARSCPPFPQEAFDPLRVEGQLYLRTTERVADERFVDLKPKKKRVFLSKIFYWYGDDFILDFGPQGRPDVKFTPPDLAVLSFIRHYIQDADKIEFIESQDYKLKFMPFDWSLAEWHREGES